MPTKKEKFLETYKSKKDSYLKNYNSKTYKGIEERSKAYYPLSNMMISYSLNALNSLNTNDLYNTINKAYQKDESYKKIIDHSIEISFYNSKLKDLKDKIEDKTPEGISEYFKNNKNEELEKEFKNVLNTNISNSFSAEKLEAPIGLFDTLLENTEMTEELIPDEKTYITILDDFEGNLEFQEEENREYLIKQSKKAKEVDTELIKYLEESKYTLAKTDNSRGLLSKYAEHVGNSFDKEIFKPEFDEFNKDDKYWLYKDDVPFETIDDVIDFNKRNILDVKPSDKSREVMLNSVEKLRKNEITGTRVHEVFNKDTEELNNLIKNTKPKQFKEKYKKFDEKIKVVDEIIKDMKTVDPNHAFTSNFTTYRNPTNPPKYLNDIEGNTLINCALEINHVCTDLKIDPKDFIYDPIKSAREVYQKQEEECKNGFDKIFRKGGGNIFDVFEYRKGYESGCEEYNNAKNRDTELDLYFPQAISALTIYNPENHYEYHMSVQNGILTAGAAHQINEKQITDATLDDNKLTNEIMPTVILTGKEFNPFKMINTETGIMDISKQERRKDFDLSIYLEKIPTEEIDARMEAGLKDAIANEYEYAIDSMKAASVNVKEALMKRSTVSEKDIDKLVKHYTNEKRLNQAEKNTIMSKIKFGEMSKNGITKDNVKQSLDSIAELNQKYKSHNALARFFFPSLRKEKKAIDEMKAKASELSGITLKGVDEYIKLTESKSVDKDEALDAYIDGLNIDEDTPEYGYNQAKENLRDNLIDKNFYMSKDEIDTKMALVDYDLKQIASQSKDEREESLKSIETLANRRSNILNYYIKLEPKLTKEAFFEVSDKILDNMRLDSPEKALEKNTAIIGDLMMKANPDLKMEDVKAKISLVGNFINEMNNSKDLSLDRENEINDILDKKIECVDLIKKSIKDIDLEKVTNAINSLGDDPKKLEEKIEMLKSNKEPIDLSDIFDLDNQVDKNVKIEENSKSLEKDLGIEL